MPLTEAWSSSIREGRPLVLFNWACSFKRDIHGAAREDGDTRLPSQISQINPGDQWGDRCCSQSTPQIWNLFENWAGKPSLISRQAHWSFHGFLFETLPALPSLSSFSLRIILLTSKCRKIRSLGRFQNGNVHVKIFSLLLKTLHIRITAQCLSP